jgi:hypothetical protein
LENEARQRRVITQDVVVNAKSMPLFSDTGTTCAIDTKYLHTIDLYCHMKTILAQSITARDASLTIIQPKNLLFQKLWSLKPFESQLVNSLRKKKTT